MKHKSVLLPTQLRRAWWSYAKLSNMCLFASISSRKPEGFASRGCCANSALNLQGPPSPGSVSSTPCSRRLPRVFFIPKSEVECARRHHRRPRGCCGSARQEADSQFHAPARQHPAPVGMAGPPQKSPCEGLRSLFSLPGFETNSLHVSLSPHQPHSCCMSLWGLD